jgi:putative flippase GtrA
MDFIKREFQKHCAFVVYCFIGVTGVCLDFLVYYILTQICDVHYQMANAIGVSCGICNNFFWNAFFNFKQKDRLLLRFCSFYCVGLLGLAISALLLWLFIGVLNWHELLSKLLIIFVVTIVQFTLNKCVTFRKG